MALPSSRNLTNPSTLVCVALGSNLGDRQGTLNRAIAAMGSTPGVAVRKVSSFHETEPVGGPPGQGMFLNAAAVLETTLGPLDLLHILKEIEETFGRVRTVDWGERTLDLDLLLFGDQIVSTPELSIPHPRLNERRFVLEPLAEIAPAAVDPVTRRTIAELLADLEKRPG